MLTEADWFLSEYGLPVEADAKLSAIIAHAVTAATADLNASEAMWHRRATLAEAALDALAKEVAGLTGWDGGSVRWIAEEDVLDAIKEYREDTNAENRTG